MGNFAIFDWNRRLSRKRYEIGPCLLWNVNRKVIGGGSIRVGSDDLEWRLTWVSRSLYTYKSNISKSVHSSLEQTYHRTLIANHTLHIEWYHVWWPWMPSKRIARVCQHQRSFLSYSSNSPVVCPNSAWLQLQRPVIESTEGSTLVTVFTLGHGLCAPFLQCLGQLSLLPSVGR